MGVAVGVGGTVEGGVAAAVAVGEGVSAGVGVTEALTEGDLGVMVAMSSMT